MAKGKKQYFNGAEVTAALNQHMIERKAALEAGLPEPTLPPIVGEAIVNVAYRYASAGKFAKVPNRQDMISHGILSAMETLPKNYDPEKSQTKNCFSFITSLVYWGFLGFFAQEKKALNEKNMYIHALADGYVTISGETVHPSNTSLKQLRGIIDEYAQYEDKKK